MSAMSMNSTQQIDVRTIALQQFRDSIICPAFPVLNARLLAMREQAPETPGYQQPRLQQMYALIILLKSYTISHFVLQASRTGITTIHTLCDVSNRTDTSHTRRRSHPTSPPNHPRASLAHLLERASTRLRGTLLPLRRAPPRSPRTYCREGRRTTPWCSGARRSGQRRRRDTEAGRTVRDGRVEGQGTRIPREPEV